MSDDPIVSIDEFLSSNKDEEAIIMGGVDGEPSCSFPRGYLRRQAVYSCKTCYNITGKRAGICYECFIQCHNEHDVIELYTKRNFRCDCGNSNFKGAAPCILWEEKDDINEQNCYDQTFDGLFCACARPYPDPDAEEELEMFQCGICEDWYHLQHIGLSTTFKPDENYEELTCLKCVQRLPLLWLYHYYAEKFAVESNTEVSINESTCEAIDEPSPKKRRISSVNTEENGTECRLLQVLKACNTETTSPLTEDMEKLLVGEFKYPSPIFWSCDWRTSILCSCASCKDLYASLNINFLTNPEDSISHYMEVGKKRVKEMDSDYASVVSNALSELPHSAAVDVARGITKLKTAMEEFLLRERETGHIITEAEVKAFCDELKKDLS